MTGNNRKGSCNTSVSYRDACVSQRSYCACYTRNFFKGNSRPAQYFDFLPAATEDERIAALQTGNYFAFPAFFRQKLTDLMLFHRVAAHFFANINIFSIRFCELQYSLICQVIADNDVRLSQAPFPFQSQQFRIPGASPDQINFSLVHVRLLTSMVIFFEDFSRFHGRRHSAVFPPVFRQELPLLHPRLHPRPCTILFHPAKQ